MRPILRRKSLVQKRDKRHERFVPKKMLVYKGEALVRRHLSSLFLNLRIRNIFVTDRFEKVQLLT
jgi:hypothetical protein